MKIYPFSPVLGANLCLSDSRRVNAFEKAIKETIKEGDVVLDVGTGTGILSLLAIRHGASKVYAIEIDQYLSSRVTEIARQNGMESEIEVINSDVFKIDSIDSHIDVLLMEKLTTGFIEEAQILAYNHLLEKRIIDPSTKSVPSAYETYAIPLNYDFNEYGFCIPRAKHTTKDDLIKKLSDRQHVSTINFDGTKKNPHVKNSIEYIINRDGNINAIGLTSVARLSQGVSLGESTWINNSVVIPLDQSFYVKRGDRIKLDITYVMGHGFLTFDTKVKNISNNT